MFTDDIRYQAAVLAQWAGHVMQQTKETSEVKRGQYIDFWTSASSACLSHVQRWREMYRKDPVRADMNSLD